MYVQTIHQHPTHQPNKPIRHRYFAFLEECQDPKACTVLLRGASKDVLNEIERNLQDALQVWFGVCCWCLVSVDRG